MCGWLSVQGAACHEKACCSNQQTHEDHDHRHEAHDHRHEAYDHRHVAHHHRHEKQPLEVPTDISVRSSSAVPVGHQVIF